MEGVALGEVLLVPEGVPVEVPVGEGVALGDSLIEGVTLGVKDPLGVSLWDPGRGPGNRGRRGAPTSPTCEALAPWALELWKKSVNQSVTPAAHSAIAQIRDAINIIRVLGSWEGRTF